jgi:CubicO group peptidase (beta-lactamase class C family)
MTHTSGLVRYEMNPKFTADLRAQPDKIWTPEEEVAYLFDATPPFAAGQGWDYSDTNYIVLGMIMEKITGTKAYDEIRTRFLTPLKLGGIVPQVSRQIPAGGYAGGSDPGLPDEMMTNGRLAINPQFEWAGGVFATARGSRPMGMTLCCRRTVPHHRRDKIFISRPQTGPQARILVTQPATPRPVWATVAFPGTVRVGSRRGARHHCGADQTPRHAPPAAAAFFARLRPDWDR